MAKPALFLEGVGPLAQATWLSWSSLAVTHESQLRDSVGISPNFAEQAVAAP
jgi:hypothetical protein